MIVLRGLNEDEVIFKLFAMTLAPSKPLLKIVKQESVYNHNTDILANALASKAKSNERVWLGIYEGGVKMTLDWYKKGGSFGLLLLFCLFPTVVTAGTDWDITESFVVISDERPDHIHREGAPFTLKVSVSPEVGGAVAYQWTDAAGFPLSPEVGLPLNGDAVDVPSPSGKAGYYGLKLIPAPSAKLPNRQRGEPRDYGFVVLPEGPFSYGENSQFGTVHADIKDPHLPSWTKTATWMTFSSKDWAYQMSKVRHFGKKELPIIADAEWQTEDSRPVSSGQLESLQQKAESYFSADRSLMFWEAGIEENLKETYRKPFYWQNLKKKMEILHAAAKEAKADVRFIYQIATRIAQDTRAFIESEASQEFSVLSLHPYAWPNFDSPDKSWLEELIQKTKENIVKNNRNLTVWFTEVGAPSFGNHAGGFFGYPELNRSTGGLSRADMAAYVAKLCVLSLANGVERIFWYNYKDAGSARDSVEMHFGLKDYLGYPKPAYASYVHVSRVLDGALPVALPVRRGDIQTAEFSKPNQRIFVVWSLKGANKLSFQSLGLRANDAKTITITDYVGSTVKSKDGLIDVGDKPLYIQVLAGSVP